MKPNELFEKLKSRLMDEYPLWSAIPAHENEARLSRILSRLEELAPGCDVSLFSAPGRTELSGNHTDHNNGIVLAAGIQLDIASAVTPSSDNRVVFHSRGYDKPAVVSLDDLALKPDEAGTTSSLIRGVAAALKQRGFVVGGFVAVAESLIPAGSGLSSSAAVEVLIACIFNNLYNHGKIDPVTMAVCAQFAENKYYGKPCGLMDQIACAMGGAVSIDFENSGQPAVKKIAGIAGFPGYALFVVLCGGNHTDLTAEYAGIPAEMKKVALFFKKDVLRGISEREFLESIPLLRKLIPDRPIMRALHFFSENRRAIRAAELLSARMIREYLAVVRESGSSSWRLLQNCLLPGSPDRQNLGLALAATETFLGEEGASRVHGGGFEGTIQAYIPEKRAAEYVGLMERLFGPGSAIQLSIREEGAAKVL
jgi:galactokinase